MNEKMDASKNGLVLNYDILIHMMLFLPAKGLFSLMRTCWVLYKAGISHHVDRETYSMKKAQLSAFFDFLLADPSRLRYLKTLTLDRGHYEEGDVEEESLEHEPLGKLGKVLSQASQLRTLTLYDADCCFIGRWGQPIGTAISSLTSLSRLDIGDIGPLSCAVLKEMRSPISSLFISVGARYDQDTSEQPDIIDLIANFKETLTNLDATDVRFERKDVQFPNVHTIRLEESYHFDFTVLHRCFPNLHKLRLTEDGPGFPLTSSIETARVENISRLRDTWMSLDILESNVNYAYILALRFQQFVETWHLPSLKNHPHEIGPFQTLLVDIRPTRLAMGISVFPELGNTVSSLENLFSRSCITHLSCDMDLTFLSPPVTPAVIDTFLVWASDLKLAFLQICINCCEAQAWAQTRLRTLPHFSPPTPVGTQLRKWDLEAYVRQLAQVSPYLRHVFFVFHFPHQVALRPPSFWGITRDGLESAIQLRSLSVEEAYAVTKDANFDVWKLPTPDHTV